jgi:hypothetical protein
MARELMVTCDAEHIKGQWRFMQAGFDPEHVPSNVPVGFTPYAVGLFKPPTILVDTISYGIYSQTLTLEGAVIYGLKREGHIVPAHLVLQPFGMGSHGIVEAKLYAAIP